MSWRSASSRWPARWCSTGRPRAGRSSRGLSAITTWASIAAAVSVLAAWDTPDAISLADVTKDVPTAGVIWGLGVIATALLRAYGDHARDVLAQVGLAAAEATGGWSGPWPPERAS
jgi:hypothetical protein